MSLREKAKLALCKLEIHNEVFVGKIGINHYTECTRCKQRKFYSKVPLYSPLNWDWLNHKTDIL